ncbi:hypothetical protein SI65_01595 [Aspergillus cristatus]|uniref:Major royal jelly protein n=1 Tax=Aspergillus cristatus TaxID=573508 RepID=A0A1E3BSU9_ASPCR|nr:hypothetical protein SI65_01595 [Aspergillus cristatus]
MVADLFVALLGLSTPLVSAVAPGLELTCSLNRATQGISISSDGRKFLSQRYSTSDPPQAVELLNDNSTRLYPNVAWNSYNSSNPNSNPRRTFVSIDGARIGPDGRYWLVDGGSQGVNGSSKLVGVNLTTDAVDKLYYLDSIIASSSSIDDVRFNAAGDVAYLSDTAGALLVLNMTTGKNILDNDYLLVGDIFATAWAGLDFSGFETGDSVAVFGSSPVGLLAALCHTPRGIRSILDYEPKGVKRSIDCIGYEAVNADLKHEQNIVINSMVSVTAQGGGIGLIGWFTAPGSSSGTPRGSTMSPTIEFPISDFFDKGLSMRSGAVDVLPSAPGAG